VIERSGGGLNRGQGVIENSRPAVREGQRYKWRRAGTYLFVLLYEYGAGRVDDITSGRTTSVARVYSCQ